MYPRSSLLGRWGAAMAAKRQAEAEADEEDQRLDEYIANMTDTIHIAYTDSSWEEYVEHRELGGSEISATSTKELLSYVSYIVPSSSDDIRYEKITVIKEDDLDNLRTRINELLKYEECKLVNFGIFSSRLSKDDIIDTFEQSAKTVLKKTCYAKALGRIWSMEVNGSGKGCGLIAADDKIHVWRDM